MDGIHDMGGMHGFGKVEPEPNEPVFHAPWEGRTLALNRAMGYTGIWTIDQTRAGIERLPPDIYLTSSYYKKWEMRLENMIVDLGLAGADELAAGHALRPGKPLKRTLKAGRRAEYAVARLVRQAGASNRPLQARRSRAHQEHPSGDATRACRAMPATRSVSSRRCAAATSIPTPWRSAKAKTHNGSTPFCSTAANCGARTADPTLKVSIEAFEPYLEPA